ncbi:metallophosphatase family protein [Sphingomonas sp. BT-65]|uniref:metallophosphoesterase family protein n=1 Tax=Sphingomonas sp. BT-65 TaxID=2989821 RepID=UPI0022366A11|nr:metallophosphoesterase family protein [Sphingomonas sp. BT-65]MCW4460280.1 metallophosphatase family protein [Sphingomonas sp. BT-65]
MIAVLSDIHGNLPALEAVITDARDAGATSFVNLGDSLSGPLWPVETADLLMREGWPTIAGNHERQVLTHSLERMGASDRFASERLSAAQLAWLAAQPPVLALTDDIFLCHGSPRSDLEPLLHTVEPAGIREATGAEIAERLGDTAAALTLCGHTHLPRVMKLPDGRTVANPGSVGLQAFHDDHPLPYVVENGDPLTRYALVRGAEVELRAVAYDHQAAAAKAAREDRDDWAVALRTGFAD